MTQFTEAQLDQLKRDNPCHKVARKWVTLRKGGKHGWIGPCPIHSPKPDARDSTSFECSADGWVCATCNEGGDVIKLVQMREQLDFVAAVERLGGVRDIDPAEEQRAEAERERKRAARDREADEYRERERSKVFHGIWRRAVPIAGTPAEAYLALRGVAAPPGAKLRCIHALDYWIVDAKQPVSIHQGPVLLAPIVRGGKFSGVHLTYLDLDQPKGKVALRDPGSGELVDAKKVRGSKKGGHIELLACEAPRRLVIGEGIEKTLAVWRALDQLGRDLSDTAFWTSVDLGNLGGKAAHSVNHPTLKTKGNRPQRVPGAVPDLEAPGIAIPDSVEEIVILGDSSSEPFLTRCAIARAAARWQKPGRRILVAWSPGRAAERSEGPARQTEWDGDFDDLLRADPSADGFRVIASAIEAAAPVEPMGDHAPPPESKSAGAAGRPHSSSASGPGDRQPSPSSASASSAAAPDPSGNGRASGATLADDEEESIDDALAGCCDLDHSDTDNGKRLIRYFGRDLLVMAQSGVIGGAFLNWRGTHWDLDGGAAGAHLLAQMVGDLIMREADWLAQTPAEAKAIAAGKAAQSELNGIDPADEALATTARKEELLAAMAAGKGAKAALGKRRRDRRRHGLHTKNKAKLENMLSCAAPRLRRPPDAFNVDPLLVATRTHTLRLIRELDPENPDPDGVRFRARVEASPAHRREDMLTAMIPETYDPEARGPKWLKFLDRVLPQQDKRRMVQSFTGIGITGLPVQRVMYHTGGGANGKSVFLEVITRLLGDSIAVGLPVESVTGIAMATGAQASPDIARLFGKRMLRVHELPEGAMLRAEVIKKLTGGERLIARELHKGFFEFMPIAKAHMSGNGVPVFDGSDGGMRRRLILAHWTETIAEAEQKDFQEFVTDLLTEGPAILSWLIAGALDYLAHGLVVDEADRAGTQSYFGEMNPVGQFAAACLAAEPGRNEKARDVYNSYVAWSLANAKKPMSEARFGRTLKKTHPRDDTGRVHVYVDVRLHDVPEPPQDRNAHPLPNEDLVF